VVARGCRATGDGAGGVFYWDSASTIGNGGTLIATTALGGRWVRIYTGMVHVTWFGAMPGTSEDRTASINNALAFCVGKETLYWPAGNYRADSNLTNLHAVKHRGPGRVTRSGAAFAVEPKAGSPNVLFVTKGGALTNDGLSTSCPLTLQGAFDVLHNYGPMLEGDWKIDVAGGTYNVTELELNIPSKRYVTISGAPPVNGVPSVVISPGPALSDYEHGMRIEGQGVQVHMKDVKFLDFWNGPESRTNLGLYVGQGAVIFAENVHAQRCSWGGICCQEASYARIGGGVFDGNRTGVIMNATPGVVGYHVTSTFRNSTQCGVLWSRGAQGHIDYSLFEDNLIGIQMQTMSRAHVLDCDFRRNGIAIMTDSGAVYFDDSNDYHEGISGQQNTTKAKHYAFSGDHEKFLIRSFSEMLVHYDDTHRTLNGGVNHSIPLWAMPQHWLVDSWKKVRVRALGRLPAALGTQVGVDLATAIADSSVVVGTPAASSGFVYECEIFPYGANSQRSFASLKHSGGERVQNGSCAAVTSLELMIKLTAHSSQALEIRRIEVWITG
jgi:hypothetical protein